MGLSTPSRPVSQKRGLPRYRKRLPVLTQMDATECGAVCLAILLNYYGRKTSVAEIRQHCGSGRDGLTARALVMAGRAYGLQTRALSLPHGNFSTVRLPAIIHWGFNHFVVVERWSPREVDIIDPALGRRRVSAGEFDASFTGIVLMFEPGEQFSRQSAGGEGLSLFTYLKNMFRLPGFFLQLLAASLLLQVFGLGMPLLTKLFLDTVIPHHMSNIFLVMALGIAILVLTQAITMLLRSSLLIYLQAKVDIQMMLGFFEHLLKLPYQFFQQRSTGDLLLRLSSNMVIRDVFTGPMISSLLDGGAVLVYLMILVSQTPTIALLVGLLGLGEVTLLLLATRFLHQLNQRDLIAQGKSQGYLTEALVGIATLKAAGAEERALHRWSNLFFEHLNISVRRDYLAAVLGTLHSTLNLLAPLLLLFVGTMQVLNGSMSVGTMLAFSALGTAFLTPLSSLVGSGQKLQLVRAHFERIADVLLTRAEQDPHTVSQPPQLRGRIELRNVSFRHSANSPLVLRDINLIIEPGQKVALVGHTGSGKSTLGKLLLGLYLPTEGEILYDSQPLQSFDYRAVRRQFGVVMQEVSLFSGSIRENIALVAPNQDLEQIRQAASMAALDEEIEHMPMKYETFVSENGSALSGGQRQRLALARALTQQPVILLLDEATSHLDVLTEQQVEENLGVLTCTRIVIAHRLSTVRDADQILVLDQGQIAERGTHEELLRQQGYYMRLVQSQLELSAS